MQTDTHTSITTNQNTILLDSPIKGQVNNMQHKIGDQFTLVQEEEEEERCRKIVLVPNLKNGTYAYEMDAHVSCDVYN